MNNPEYYVTDEKDFLVICITPENPYFGEPDRLKRILIDNEADIIHLRHPGLSRAETKSLLLRIPENLRSRITLHDHHELAAECLAGGIHLNSRNPEAPTGLPPHIRISASCHSIDEVTKTRLHNLSYVTLSPIFDSISKQGYKSAFNVAELKELLPHQPIKVIALGGITPDHFPSLRDAGFAGAAMLGYFLY